MALSFTPDGYLVAAASYNKILIWRAEEGGLPKAYWVGEKGKWMGGVGAITSAETREDGGDDMSEVAVEEEERGQDHSLSWDADGGKLAFGLGSQVRWPRLNRRILIWFCFSPLSHVSLLGGWKTETDHLACVDRNHQFPQIIDTTPLSTPCFAFLPRSVSLSITAMLHRTPTTKLWNFQEVPSHCSFAILVPRTTLPFSCRSQFWV